jgi:hypothetical protein
VREAVLHRIRGRGFPGAPLRVRRSGPERGPLGGARCCAIGATHAPCGTEDDVLYARVPAESPAAGEVWDAGTVAVAPRCPSGRRLGPPIEMSARILSAQEEERAKRALGRSLMARLRLPRDYLYLELRPLSP